MPDSLSVFEILTQSSNTRDNNVPRGWGVLVLPESSFLPTSTYQESLGLSPEEAVYVNNVGYGYYIGTGRAVGNIKDNSLRHPWVKAGQLGRFRSVPARSDWTLRKWYDTELDCNNNNWSASHDEAVEKSSKRVSPSRHRMNDTGNVPAILNNGSSGESFSRNIFLSAFPRLVETQTVYFFLNAMSCKELGITIGILTRFKE